MAVGGVTQFFLHPRQFLVEPAQMGRDAAAKAPEAAQQATQSVDKAPKNRLIAILSFVLNPVACPC